MARVVTLLILGSLVLCVSSDQILPKTLQKIFPYAEPAKVKVLTTNVNKQTAIAKAKTVVKNWIPKNWKAAGAKVDAKNQLSKQAYAQKKALTFIDHRYSLKKYINFMYNQAINTKYLTKAEAENMRKIFWAADTKGGNDCTQTCDIFAAEAAKKIQKTPPIDHQIYDWMDQFHMKNPTDFDNMQWKL